MRLVVQRVSDARVTVDGEVVGSIGAGLAILVGVGAGDTEPDAEALARKVTDLRVFPDAEGKMNRSLREIGGSALVVSQFTLYGDTRKGRRPSYAGAADPQTAKRLYELFAAVLTAEGIPVAAGIFQAHMVVSLTNDGPVTLVLRSGQDLPL